MIKLFEEFINESFTEKSIIKLVNEINGLIDKAKDSDGDPIGVIDKTSTWEEPYIYFPIEYTNGKLIIKTKSLYKNDIEKDIILKRNMEEDGIPTLKSILKQYKKITK